MLPLVQRLVAIFESVAVIVLFCMAVLRMDRNYFAPLISQRPLSLALAFLSVQFAVIAGEFVLSMTILAFKTVRKRRSEAAQSRIAPLLLAWLDGEVNVDELSALCLRRRKDFEKVLVDTIGLVTGSGKERLASLASELGCTAGWKRACFSPRAYSRKEAVAKLAFVAGKEARSFIRGALWDASPRVRTEAVRALLHIGHPPDVYVAFRTVLGLPPLSRLLLAAEFRPFAAGLAREAIPRVFQRGSRKEVLAALEMIENWSLACELPALTQVLESEDLPIRAAAIRVAPLAFHAERALATIHSALESHEPALQQAAVGAASRFADSSLLPAVARCAGSVQYSVARTACAALAGMGRRGVATLESRALDPNPLVSARALEALERIRTQPFVEV